MPSDKKSSNEVVQKKTTKKHGFIVILIALVLIPLIWAFVNAKTVDNKGFFGTQFDISLYDQNKSLIVTDSSIAEYSSARSAVFIFHNILLNMQKVSSDAVDVSSRPEPITADIKVNNILSTYKFYFAKNDLCYCIDQQGQAYTITTQDAHAFMNSSYSECVYSSATPPALITGNGETIPPHYQEWYYKNTAGNFTSAASVASTSKIALYEITGYLDITFKEVPDICKIKVFRDDALIFSGTYEDLPNMIIDTGTRLKAEISAEWSYSADAQYYGKTNYVFYADINNYADFSVNSSTVTPDGFVIISGTNIENISNIDIKPILQDDSLLYPHETIFTPRGDNAYCLLVFPNDLERGNYCFNVTYGTFSKDFSISFSDKQEDIVLYNSHKSFETIYFYTKNETINELVNSAQSLPRDLVESLYFSDKFVDPTTFGYKTEYLYNTYISCDDGSLVYSALGNRYYNETDVETSVYAINGGKVISVGNNLYLGNFVVIEHGLGIRTWYANLSHINVKVGDYVAREEKIGRSGSHESSLYDGFLLMCSVYDIFVDVNYCLDEKTLLH
jgi:hypothetical protein